MEDLPTAAENPTDFKIDLDFEFEAPKYIDLAGDALFLKRSYEFVSIGYQLWILTLM